jgi:hypothetical protein
MHNELRQHRRTDRFDEGFGELNLISLAYLRQLSIHLDVVLDIGTRWFSVNIKSYLEMKDFCLFPAQPLAGTTSR